MEKGIHQLDSFRRKIEAVYLNYAREDRVVLRLKVGDELGNLYGQ